MNNRSGASEDNAIPSFNCSIVFILVNVFITYTSPFISSAASGSYKENDEYENGKGFHANT
ncbi:hypothetical protein J45TS6_03580 [Paenibacillus sp. J45TS6]|nr:hypothetical protein J45TS6_03580 [Paenibacillus sp. J45TS6]